jgi:hypothetical protein
LVTIQNNCTFKYMSNSFTRVDPKDIQFYIRLEPGEFKLATHFALIPTTDPGFKEGWEDIIYLKEPVVDASGGVRATEYVYVLVNKSMPGMVKIGMTTDTPQKRAYDINKATGVPTPWVPVWWLKCYASGILERRVHEHLSEYRVADNREMFSIDSVTAQKVIEDIGKDFTNVLIAGKIEQQNHLQQPVDIAQELNQTILPALSVETE